MHSNMRSACCVRLIAGAIMVAALSTAAHADIFQREGDITALRLGQRAYVDDGSCPAGQIKEIVGMRLTATGVERTRKCVERKGKR